MRFSVFDTNLQFSKSMLIRNCTMQFKTNEINGTLKVSWSIVILEPLFIWVSDQVTNEVNIDWLENGVYQNSYNSCPSPTLGKL